MLDRGQMQWPSAPGGMLQALRYSYTGSSPLYFRLRTPYPCVLSSAGFLFMPYLP